MTILVDSSCTLKNSKEQMATNGKIQSLCALFKVEIPTVHCSLFAPTSFYMHAHLTGWEQFLLGIFTYNIYGVVGLKNEEFIGKKLEFASGISIFLSSMYKTSCTEK